MKKKNYIMVIKYYLERVLSIFKKKKREDHFIY